MTNCKTCRHWDRAAAEDMRGMIHSSRIALCRWRPTCRVPYWVRDYPYHPSAQEGVQCEAWEPHGHISVQEDA
jgi:hypothetical protein